MSFHTFDQNVYREVLIAPAAQGSLNSSYYDPFVSGEATRTLVEILVGTVAGDFDVAVYQAIDSSGTDRKALTGAALTTITTANDNTLNTIEVSDTALDDVNGFKYIRVEVTVASGTPVWSAVRTDFRLRNPGRQTQDATYAQQVRVE